MGEDQKHGDRQNRELPHHRKCRYNVLEEGVDGLVHVSSDLNTDIRTVYNLSTLKHENIQQTLYQRYTETINKYLSQMVLPELQKLAQEEAAIGNGD